MYQQAFLFSIR